jgi:hypothetical protein
MEDADFPRTVTIVSRNRRHRPDTDGAGVSVTRGAPIRPSITSGVEGSVSSFCSASPGYVQISSSRGEGGAKASADGDGRPGALGDFDADSFLVIADGSTNYLADTARNTAARARARFTGGALMSRPGHFSTFRAPGTRIFSSGYLRFLKAS